MVTAKVADRTTLAAFPLLSEGFALSLAKLAFSSARTRLFLIYRLRSCLISYTHSVTYSTPASTPVPAVNFGRGANFARAPSRRALNDNWYVESQEVMYYIDC